MKINKMYYIILLVLVVTVIYGLSKCWKENMDNDNKRLLGFFMNGCAHCEKFKPTWDNLSIPKDEYYMGKDDDMVKKYNITGFPTVILTDGKITKEYDGDRTKEDVEKFYNTN